MGRPKNKLRFKSFILVFLLFVISLGVFANSLQNSFVWDDTRYIILHPFIKDFSNIKYFFNLEYFTNPEKMLSLGMYNIGRPAWVISAMLDYALWGENPFGHHLTNIILHAFCVLLLFITLNRLFKNLFLSFLASLLFALHPIHTETINVVTFRTDMLCLVFMLLSIISFLKMLSAQSKKWIAFLILSLLSLGLACLSKEMAVMLPALLGLYLWLFLPKQIWAKNKTRFIIYAGIISFAGVFYLLLHKSHFFYGSAAVPVAYLGRGALAHFVAISLTLAKYMRLLLLPIGLNADYGYNASNYIQPLIWLSFILTGGVLVIAWFLRRKEEVISFAIFWFFITILPVSNLIPLVNVVAERYLYIPSVGFCILIAALLLKLWRTRLGLAKVLTVSLFIITVLFYSFTTFNRNLDWRDNLTIWSKTARQSPDNFRVRDNLGKALRVAGRTPEAILQFERALKINPRDYIAYCNLGICYKDVGRLEDSFLAYQKALEIMPKQAFGRGHAEERYWIAHIQLGNLYLEEGLLDGAIEEYLAVIAVNPDFAPAYYNLGNIFLKKNQVKEAEKMYQKILALYPHHPQSAEVYVNLGVLSARKGDLITAKKLWKHALELDPNLSSAKENLEKLERKQ